MKTTPTTKLEELSMLDSTQACSRRAITVPFHGADLYVVEHNGQPYTPMKPVVAGMGLDWAAQFSKLKSNPVRWGIAEIAIPTISGVQVMLCLPLRKLFGWLAGINTGKIRAALRDTVATYQNECDDVLWQYWTDGIAINPRKTYAVNSGDTLTAAEAEKLRTMLKSAVDRLPKEKQGAAMMQGWSKLKSHFGVSYRNIPAHEFTEAVSLVSRHIATFDPEHETQQVVSAASGKMLVDRRKLAAIWNDLGALRRRIDGLGMIESDLPPSWWQGNAISHE